MGWCFTDDVERYADAVLPLLSATPVECTVALTVIATARARAGGPRRLFGWWADPAGRVSGAVSHTPPYELLLARVPDEAVEALVTALAQVGSRPPGVHGTPDLAGRFAVRWTAATGQRAVLQDAHRLYRLGELTAPEPPPLGRSRLAEAGDRELLAGWLGAFDRETGMHTPDPPAQVDDRLLYGGLVVWEEPAASVASFAGLSRPVAGMARIGPVYTPPEHRGHGYAAGVTVAAVRRARQVGAEEVVLFTDLTNPTSNALYQRLGFRSVGDRLVFRFEPSFR